MRITAMIDRVELRQNLEKLSRVMGQTFHEVVKGQARLITRDCIKRTPPFTGQKGQFKPNTEGFPKQLRAGEIAIRNDLLRVFRPANSFWSMCKDKDGNKGELAKKAARLARRGDLEGLKKLNFRSPILQKIKALQRQADPNYYEMTRSPATGRPYTRPNGVLVHKGTVPTWETTVGKRGVTNYGGLSKIYKAKIARIGLAKAGWLTALKRLDGTPKMSARWINRHQGRATGYLRWNVTKPAFPVVTVANTVPHVQQAGRERRIVENAIRDRSRNLPKQIEAAVRAQKRAKTIGIK